MDLREILQGDNVFRKIEAENDLEIMKKEFPEIGMGDTVFVKSNGPFGGIEITYCPRNMLLFAFGDNHFYYIRETSRLSIMQQGTVAIRIIIKIDAGVANWDESYWHEPCKGAFIEGGKVVDYGNPCFVDKTKKIKHDEEQKELGLKTCLKYLEELKNEFSLPERFLELLLK